MAARGHSAMAPSAVPFFKLLPRVSAEVATFGRGDLSVCPLGISIGAQECLLSNWRGVPPGSSQRQTLRAPPQGHFCASPTPTRVSAAARLCGLPTEVIVLGGRTLVILCDIIVYYAILVLSWLCAIMQLVASTISCSCITSRKPARFQSLSRNPLSIDASQEITWGETTHWNGYSELGMQRSEYTYVYIYIYICICMYAYIYIYIYIYIYRERER